MKRIILLIVLCLSLSAIYAQTLDVIHLKNGFDARGTITNRTESLIILQTENGKVLTIDMTDIDSMEQEQKAFDPRALIGRWSCYKSSGERDAKYDFEIKENEGFYFLIYDEFAFYQTNESFIGRPEGAPTSVTKKTVDIVIDDNGGINCDIMQTQCGMANANSSRKAYASFLIYDDTSISLFYIDGKLKGSLDNTYHYWALGDRRYGHFIKDAVAAGAGRVMEEGALGQWNVYFVKN